MKARAGLHTAYAWVYASWSDSSQKITCRTSGLPACICEPAMVVVGVRVGVEVAQMRSPHTSTCHNITTVEAVLFADSVHADVGLLGATQPLHGGSHQRLLSCNTSLFKYTSNARPRPPPHSEHSATLATYVDAMATPFSCKIH